MIEVILLLFVDVGFTQIRFRCFQLARCVRRVPQVHLNDVLKRQLRTRVVFLVLEQCLGVVKSALFICALLFNFIDLPSGLSLQRAFDLCEPLPNLFGLIELAVLPEFLGLLLLFQILKRRCASICLVRPEHKNENDHHKHAHPCQHRRAPQNWQDLRQKIGSRLGLGGRNRRRSKYGIAIELTRVSRHTLLRGGLPRTRTGDGRCPRSSCFPRVFAVQIRPPRNLTIFPAGRRTCRTNHSGGREPRRKNVSSRVADLG